MRKLIAALAALVLFAAAVAPAKGQTSESSGTINAGSAPADSQIDERITMILHAIDGLEGILVTVRSGVVTLRGRVTDPALAQAAERLATRVEGVVAVSNQIKEVTSVSQRIVPAWERLRSRTLQIVNSLPLMALATLVFLFIGLVGWAIAASRWPWDRIAANEFIAHLLRQIVRLVFVALGLVVALDIVGASALLGTILGAAGIVGLAVGFAVRDTVENYIASVLLSVRQPFRPNDWVAIDAIEGSVVMLTSRATVLLDADGNHIRVPNSTVFNAAITNYSRNPERRFSFMLGIDPAANLRAAMDLGNKTVREVPFTLNDPPPESWIEDIGDSVVKINFTAWVNQSATSYIQARSEAIRLTKLALERNGFALPEPSYRVLMEHETPGSDTHAETALTPARSGAKSTGAAAKPESARPADTSADHVVERKVNEERAKAERGDLLSNTAPQELGS